MLKPIDDKSTGALKVQEAYQEFLDRLPVRKPRKLLFVSVPQVPADLFLPETADRDGYYTYPPTGFLYLAAAARLAIPDIELKVLDLNFEMLRRCRLGLLDQVDGFWKEILDQEISGSEHLRVCVGNNWFSVTPMFLEVTRYIKDNFKDVTLVTGGVETTQSYKRVVDGDYCHIAFRHDAEVPFRRFLESCQGIETSFVPHGIAFKLDNNFYETEPSHEPSKEFLDIRPYYHLIEVENYYRFGGLNPFARYLGKGKVYGTVLSNRGCRASCTFCGVLAFYPNGVRPRTARSVVDEIKFLVEEKGVRLIDWLDDDLVYSKKGSVELFKLMAEELPSDFEWTAVNGITGCAITEEIMYWMVKSGCKAFRVGVESGNEAMLLKIRKPATKDGLRQAGIMFNKYPEVFREMMDTFDFANELSWDWAHYSICQPAADTADIYGRPTEGLIPARQSEQTGAFGYEQKNGSTEPGPAPVLSGRDVFDLPRDQVPSGEQIKEIWFTFNIVTNFFSNRNFASGGDTDKIVRWFESISASYPRDASMYAMLAYGHGLLGNKQESLESHETFHRLHTEFDYWQRRVREFPELLEYAG